LLVLDCTNNAIDHVTTDRILTEFLHFSGAGVVQADYSQSYPIGLSLPESDIDVYGVILVGSTPSLVMLVGRPRRCRGDGGGGETEDKLFYKPSPSVEDGFLRKPFGRWWP
jgi:hypothetical protein